MQSEPFDDSGDEDEPTEEEVDIMFHATRLALGQDEVDNKNDGSEV